MVDKRIDNSDKSFSVDVNWERSHSNWNKPRLIGTTSTGIFSIICLNYAPLAILTGYVLQSARYPQGERTGAVFVENYKFCKKVSVVDKLL